MDPLANGEKEQLQCFEVETLDLTQNEVEGLNYVSCGITALLKGCKQQRIASNTTYMDLKLIPITNNIVESFSAM
jgi:hypothetical protein